MTLDYIKEKAKQIDEKLEQVIDQLAGVPVLLRESMKYSLLAGGKRIRPVLVLATVEALNGDTEKAFPFACAIEMIHTYSLIHDDLPSMDNDDYRRGKLTNHKKFSEGTAILAGDALLTEAFGLIAKGAKETQLSAAIALTMIEEGARFAGARGMIAGQVYDLQSENQKISLSELENIHRLKTGDLMVYAIRMGAYIAGANQSTLQGLTEFGYGLGLAFQIQDDILDVIGDQSKLGKPVGSDQENHKSTYPVLLGLEEAKQKLSLCIKEAKEKIIGFPELKPQRLLEIADYLILRDR
ncbi:polyprenyl synthetase family protein [Thermoflavimicrobium daqui]|uniref:Farnesyl diphosphate synthase n=1 Tax=Thermoflavimicrobium daqui TaxID=2137476 RepID=A0A364K9W8_9BACL|nr:farnesyl diphosphate synthase [Thermoflavimicrobium daqui]RAL27097.1 polyprenyl synthetase [Thermoflavimicrobium daqui]